MLDPAKLAATATVQGASVQDVRDSLEAEGLTCMESGGGPFVQEGKALDGEVTDKWTEINCGDFEEARDVLTSTPLVVSVASS